MENVKLFCEWEGGSCVCMRKDWRIISGDFQGLSENVFDREQSRKEEKEKEWGKVLKE